MADSKSAARKGVWVRIPPRARVCVASRRCASAGSCSLALDNRCFRETAAVLRRPQRLRGRSPLRFDRLLLAALDNRCFRETAAAPGHSQRPPRCCNSIRNGFMIRSRPTVVVLPWPGSTTVSSCIGRIFSTIDAMS